MAKDKIKLFFKNFKDPKYILTTLIIFGLYFLSARFGLSLAGPFEQVSLVWPATGIAISALLIAGIKYWPAIFIGAFLANLAGGTALTISFWIGLGNMLEAYIAALLLKKVGFRNDIGRVRDSLLFILIASILATGISATFGVVSLIYGGIGSWSQFWQIWREWWIGDMIGALIVAPFILVRSDLQKYFKINLRDLITQIILTAVFIFICTLVATPFISPELIRFPLQYLLLPTIILSSFLLKQYGSTWKMLILAFFSVWSVLMGWSDSSLLGVQFFLGILATFFMVFAALVAEHDEALAGVKYSERKFKSMIEHSFDGIILVDVMGKVIYASPTTERVLGWKAEDVVGKSGFDLIYPADRKLMKNKLTEILSESGKIVNTEYRSLHKDGKVHYMEGTGINLLTDPAVNAIVVNFRDISERKKIDNAKNEFVSFTAHELRGPLSTIRWYMEVLLALKEAQGAKMQEYLWAIYSANLRMTDTVNMLLNINRMEMGSLLNRAEPTDIKSLVKQSVLTFDEEIKTKKLTLTETYPSGETPRINIDPNLAGIFVNNLISNAVKYTPEGGKISVKVEVAGDRLDFKVEDTGVGIPENQKSRIFTKAFRADNVREIVPQGTGLGLYLTKSVVDQMGGKIGFESNKTKGTTFWVKIPI